MFAEVLCPFAYVGLRTVLDRRAELGLDEPVPVAQAASAAVRVIAAAAELTAETGWSAVTMGKLAERVGVSRQTVYNELGNKAALAEAMVLRELEAFLRGVESAFDDNPDDLVAAIRAAAESALTRAVTNPLLHAVLTSLLQW